MDRKKAYYWCCYLQMISPGKIRKLIDSTENPEDIFGMSDEKIAQVVGFTKREYTILHSAAAMERRIDEEYEKLKINRINFVSQEEAKYPARLKEVSDYPPGLFYKGRLPDNSKCAVAVVGARACDDYGRRTAQRIASEIASAGVEVISGLAYGIDAAAGNGACSSRASYAVLAGGVDICYPIDNYPLYEKIINTGGIISEMLPQTRGTAILFPRRNRIISGMADAVIIVQARKKSGSLITADYALEQGREVFAVPGPIDSDLSTGCNELIKNGAALLQRTEDLFTELNMPVEAHMTENISEREKLTSVENDVYLLIDPCGSSVEDLIEKSGYPAGMLYAALTSLELKGYIMPAGSSQYKKTI